MNYISVSLLENRVGSARLNNLCSGSAVLEEIIARAEGIVDGYASVRYATPLVPTPAVREWVLSIAEYELYRRGPGSAVPGKIADSYKTALEQLAALSEGRMGTGAVLAAGSRPAPVCVSGGRRSVLE